MEAVAGVMHRLKLSPVALLPVMVLIAGCEPAERQGAHAGREKPPHIIWLTVESLRADHIGCYGYAQNTTPNIDALAAEGTLFSNAFAVTSWTLTSHASMFTGLYPSAHQVIRPKGRLADAHLTVAEVLREAGYQTAAVVSGSYLARPHNLHQGFEQFDDTPITPPGGNASRDITNPRMEAAITRFLREQREGDRPVFLFCYFWDPHSRYIPPPPYDAMFVPPGAKKIENVQFSPVFKLGRHITEAQLLYLVAQYDGEIRCTDEYLGRLWALLKELGLWDDSAIVLTSDHGEEFYDHGCNSHKNTLYVESLHVPLIIKLPGQKRPVRDDRIVNLIDLYPTVLELAGCGARQPQSGRSLLAAPQEERPTFYELQTLWTFKKKSTNETWQESDAWTAVRRGHYKLVHVKNLMNRHNLEKNDRWELYDCIADPRELHPLGAGFEETVGELRQDLRQWREAMKLLARSRGGGGPASLSQAQEQRLRSLGYLP